MRPLELKHPPLRLTAIFLALIAVASLLVPSASLPFPHHRIIGSGLILMGVAMILGAAFQFRLQRTTLDPKSPERASQFVARGLYRISRNPMYLGMALLLLGTALWSANAVAVALVAGFCVYLTELQIKPEERALEGVFGAQYLSYKARVRRWI